MPWTPTLYRPMIHFTLHRVANSLRRNKICKRFSMVSQLQMWLHFNVWWSYLTRSVRSKDPKVAWKTLLAITPPNVLPDYFKICIFLCILMWKKDIFVLYCIVRLYHCLSQSRLVSRNVRNGWLLRYTDRSSVYHKSQPFRIGSKIVFCLSKYD